MSNQQPPVSRPWLRLATMIRPPPPPPAPAPTPNVPSNQGPSPPRPAIIRPAFAPIPPPQQPSPTPPPTQQPNLTPPSEPPTPSPPPPQQPSLTPYPPPTTQPTFPAANVMEPATSAPPTSTSRKSPPSSPPKAPPRPSLTATRSSIATTRATTPPSSLEPTPPPLPPTNMVSPPVSPPSRSPPKKLNLISSPPPSPPRAPVMQQTEQPLPPYSPQKTISPAPSTRYPVSPLVLPSLKQKPYDEGLPEYMQKTVDVQETKEIPKNSTTGFNGRHTHSSRKPETHKKHSDSEDAGKNIITIAGENKGAIMKITPFSDKHRNFLNDIHINRHKPTSSNNGETESVAKNKNQNSNELMKTSFLNSNVQGVNNSILFNCSINHHDPGIHLILSSKSDRDSGIHSKEHKKG